METINLNLIPDGRPPILHASQYDVGRDFRIYLFDGTAPLTLSGTEVITLSLRKPDGNIVTTLLTNTSSNYVDFSTILQMTAVEGSTVGEISITAGADTLGTLNFILEVEEGPTNGGVQSDSAFVSLQTQIDEVLAENLSNIAGTYFSRLDILPEQKVYYDNNGTIASASGTSYWRALVIDVAPGEVYKLTFNSHGVNYLGVLFGNNGAYVGGLYSDTAEHTTNYTDVLVVIPTGVNRLYVNCYTDYSILEAKKGYYDTDARFDEVLDLSGILYERLFANVEQKVWRNSGGTVASVSGGSYWRAVALNVAEGEAYRVSTNIYGNTTYGIVFADDNATFKGQYLFAGQTTSIPIEDYLVIVPTGATKMYVNTRYPSNFAGTIVVKKGYFNADDLIDIRSAEAAALTKVQGHNRTERFFNFGFITDTHINDHPNGQIMLESLGRVSRIKNLDAIYHGGDYITTTDISTLNDYFVEQYKYIAQFNKIEGLVFIQGNHDVGHSNDLSADASVTQYNILFNINGNGGTKNPSEPDNDYWYKDFAEYKIRVICLESFNLKGQHKISATELAWLTGTAFNVPAGYTTLLLTHYIDNDDYSDAVTAIKSFMTTHDFAGVIIGHRHAQSYDNSNDFGIIGCDAGFNSYAMFTIDTTNQIIYESSVGATDRAFHYGRAAADNYEIV